MKEFFILLVVTLMSLASTQVFAAISCDELKDKIAKKVEGKGVKNYQLEVIAADQETSKRIVGTCERGKKKITYERSAQK